MHTYNQIALRFLSFVAVVSASAIPAAHPGAIPDVYRPWLQKRDLVLQDVTSPDSPWGPLLRSNASQGCWMAKVSDSTPLTRINMPGTHDTMTGSLSNSSYENNPFKTQLSPLSVMLNSGIRFIDIRCHHVNNAFEIWHTFANTGKTFTDVLQDLKAFLKTNPSETIIMRIHNENDYTGDSKTNNRTFGETYDWYQNINPDTKHIFKKRQFAGPFTAWPLLGAARGKFLVLVNFDPTPFTISKYGYDYQNSSPLFDIEDAYQIKKSITEKWYAVTSHLTTVKAATDSTKLYITYCSATSASILPIDLIKFDPYHVAIKYEAPMGSYDGINMQLWPTLPDKPRAERLGILIFDFPGQDLVDAVISKN